MVTSIAISLIAVAVFLICLKFTDIIGVARQVFQMTELGVSAMMNPEFDDDAKEAAVRQAGFALVRAAIAIFWRIACALCAAVAPIIAADWLGVLPRSDVFGLMLRIDYILIVSLGIFLAITVMRRARASTTADPSDKTLYSATDRVFHELAFSSPVVLKSASWIEDKTVLRARSDDVQAPIFITSLARGATTALLNAFYGIPGMATHIYRDMPFVTAPVLWYRLSGGQRRLVRRQQRAHGDGLEIDLDTPEAFEEIVWKMWWSEKFRGDAIETWRGEDHNAKAECFLRRHMAKIVQARRLQGRVDAVAETRYVSKNNANLARLGFLIETFPDCKIIVPVRRPECHAASLLRQHKNFLQRHAVDDFTRRYMRDIGHFEFGMNHKPILFPGLEPSQYNPTHGDYWIDYWVHAFRHVLAHRDDCIFVLQDDLRATPQETMTQLCRKLGVRPGAVRFDQYFHSEPDVTDVGAFNPKLYERALNVYSQIERVAPESGAQS